MQTRKFFLDLAVRPHQRNVNVPRTPSLGVKQLPTLMPVTTILSSNSSPELKRVENSDKKFYSQKGERYQHLLKAQLPAKLRLHCAALSTT